ncbi:hypothetical protein PBOI14_42990 [Pseudomonas sp. Boi14]|nr:hypothetical protein PBOI14_42990 [Pseudomonas sp. Boi14]
MQRFACRAAFGLILSLGGMSLAAAASLPPATEGIGWPRNSPSTTVSSWPT